MKKLLIYLKDYKKECLFAPLFKMLEAIFELLVPLVMAEVIDAGIAKGDISYIVRMCLVMVGLGIAGLLCSVTAQYFAAKAATGFGTGVRHALFSHILNLSFTNQDKIGTSTLITRMTSDVNQAQNGVNMVLRLFLRSPFIVFGAMVMAFTIDKKAAMVFAAAIPLLSAVVFGVIYASIPLYRKVQDKLDAVTLSTRENLTGVRVIRAFHLEEDEKKEYGRRNQELTAMQMFVGRISGLMNPVTYVIINGATAWLIYRGALQVNYGVLTQGEVVALVNYMSQILVELIKLANLIVTITKAIACGNRIQSVFEIPAGERVPASAGTSPADSADSAARRGTEMGGRAVAGQKNETGGRVAAGQLCEAGSKAAAGQAEAGQEPDLAGGPPDAADRMADEMVVFSHVGLTYEGAGAESLTDISFTAKRGDTIGIIGGTGSGKTSLVHLIPGFYPHTAGSIRIGGKDISSYSKEELRDKAGIVMQKSVLFSGTIRENLCWGRKDASDEELAEALRTAQALDVVEKKEGGLSAMVAQGGKNFSGGQRQRLAIARALVKNPEILILDDSASALDYATDAALRRAIAGMEGGTTVFIVSQRASSVQNADQILVLDDGELAGAGTHEELLETCEVYQEIYYSQFPEQKKAQSA